MIKDLVCPNCTYGGHRRINGNGVESIWCDLYKEYVYSPKPVCVGTWPFGELEVSPIPLEIEETFLKNAAKTLKKMDEEESYGIHN